MRGYSSREVADLADVTYRQVHYWCRIGLMVPSIRAGVGSGSRRRFSEDDVALVRRVRYLLDEGYTLRGAFARAEESA